MSYKDDEQGRRLREAFYQCYSNHIDHLQDQSTRLEFFLKKLQDTGVNDGDVTSQGMALYQDFASDLGRMKNVMDWGLRQVEDDARDYDRLLNMQHSLFHAFNDHRAQHTPYDPIKAASNLKPYSDEQVFLMLALQDMIDEQELYCLGLHYGG